MPEHANLFLDGRVESRDVFQRPSLYPRKRCQAQCVERACQSVVEDATEEDLVCVLSPWADRQLDYGFGDIREPGCPEIILSAFGNVHRHPCGMHGSVQSIAPEVHVCVVRNSVVVGKELPLNLNLFENAAWPQVSEQTNDVSFATSVVATGETCLNDFL